MKAKYINPFTDFGFKKIFGEEASKPQLMDFLNALLPPNSQIKNLSFKNTEHLGQMQADRKSLFDIYCIAQSGERFIVELQKAKQNFFKDRTVYYSTFPIQEQAEKGEWNYNLTPVFCIGILDFTFDDYETEPEKNEVIHTIKLKNQYGKVFYEKLTYIYLEMPNFILKETALKTRLDKWLFFIKNLEDFQSIPSIFKEEIIFEKAFEKAELAKFSHIEWESYERSLKDFRDAKGIFDYAKETAFDEGKTAGMMEGKIQGNIESKIEIALKAKNMGLKIEDIMVLTGLSRQAIDAL
jgi:predicted transposase/invertase (TIGR01784 family)